MRKSKIPQVYGKPKILLVDIETFPNEVRTWRLWDGRALKVLKFSNIVCFSAKFLGGKSITLCLADFGGDEKKLTKALYDLVCDADILVAHNGKAFDFGRMNSQFTRHGFKPPTPTQKVDTKKSAKRVFGFDSNSLDLLCQYLGIGKKKATGGYEELWEGCIANDPKAWRKMKSYNKHDITLLEGLYLRLRPWMPDHPNVNLFEGDCPKCGSERMQSRGVYRSTTRIYNRFQCQNCGGWSKAPRSVGRSEYTNVNG
jgi:hypothetical protein